MGTRTGAPVWNPTRGWYLIALVPKAWEAGMPQAELNDLSLWGKRLFSHHLPPLYLRCVQQLE